MIRWLLVYFEMAALLAVGAALFWLVQRLALRSLAHQAARAARFALLLVGAALVLPAIWTVLGAPGGPELPVQVWSGAGAGAGPPVVTVSLAATAMAAPAWRIEGPGLLALALALALGISAALARLVWQARRLGRLCRALPVVRRIGRVTLCAADRCASPFAARVDGRAYIVVPTGMWSDPAQLRLVVAHEAHHHRRGDLIAARALALVRALFFWNPAAHLWDRLAAAAQELACDRFVVDRRAAAPGAYARCLVWAAELALAPRFRSWSVTPMAAAPAAFLRRRIEMLMPSKRVPRTGWLVPALAVALGVVAASSLLAHAAVGDRRVSRERAAAAAARAGQGALPVEVDEAVVEALNLLVATPAGRARLDRALSRLPTYRAMIEGTLAKNGLPAELMAVAMMESGFYKDARHAGDTAGRRGLGIWQMIPAAARAHGLRVEGAVDERLDAARQTEAAAAMLSGLHRHYGDWLLALAAYNRGRTAVDKLVAEAGTRDGRALYRRGALGGYVTQVLAGVLVLRDPSLLE
jgi:beta-lactamase regulating signal transducer with metallopeptidase domain